MKVFYSIYLMVKNSDEYQLQRKFAMNEAFWLTHCYHLTLTLIMFLTSHPYSQKLKKRQGVDNNEYQLSAHL
ncbi:Uncharacterised protein [Escherichia coli]|nr:Uncharacterised protein [Escherichia coli]